MGATTALLHAALYRPESVVAIDPGGLYLPDFADRLAQYVEGLLGSDFDVAFRSWEHNSFDLDEAQESELHPALDRWTSATSHRTWSRRARDPRSFAHAVELGDSSPCWATR